MRSFLPHLDGFQYVGDQLFHHLRNRARVAVERQSVDKRSVASPRDFERRMQRQRASMLEAIGGLPELPDVVPSEIRGHIEEETFRIDLIALETLPGVFATANLYVPRRGRERSPAVLFLCGHAKDAKAYPEYQRVCRSLAEAGTIVLALDPIGQGERLQYVDPASGFEQIRWGTEEHTHAGFQCTVAGMNIARYFVADAMQAVSYLRSRSDVDETCIGVTGNSGGGTQASYLMFLDDRIACGAPFTFITSRDDYLATGQAHDAEQNLLGAILNGPGYDDLAAGLCPKPVMLGAVASDFFGIEGTLETFANLQDAYALYGQRDRVHLAIAPGTHAYAPALRDQVTRFFRTYLLGETAGLSTGVTSFAGPDESPLPSENAPALPAIPTLAPEDLAVTEERLIAAAVPGSKTVFDLNLAAWREIESSRPRARAEAEALLSARVFARRPRPPMWVRTIGVDEDPEIRCFRRFTFTEPGIAVPIIELLSVGVAADAPITVVLTDDGTQALERREPWIRELVAREKRILLFDPRGSGATAPNPINPADPATTFGTLFRLNYDAMMLGDSILAMRVFDAYRVLEYAHRLSTKVAAHGEGTQGTVLLLAAFLDGDVQRGRFEDVLGSWTSIIEERLFDVDHLFEVHGLAHLPDAGAIAAWRPEFDVRGVRDARGIARQDDSS